ncbi:BTB/POZ domain-containing protein 9-like [Oppia nitens]|uniref:BTB/POZ domain-containing protein 9-like n=1 Tax=Oppia nitens TaxID=1686743 RepID=UPI0023DCD584|nr:BTB/POZ domain-containing protein 9-like [Oppia nitens]
MADDNVNNDEVTTDDVVVVVDNELYPEVDLLMNAYDDCDVQFVVDGQSIPAHKLFMRAKSQVFRSMFSGQWLESDGKPIEIRDTTPEAFKVMVGYIYTEHLMFSDDNGGGKDMDHIRDVLKLADRYQLKRLMASVGQHLISMISMDTIEVIGRLAFDYQLVELIARLKSFIDQNFKQLIGKSQPELNSINTAVNNLLFEKLFSNYRSIKQWTTI